MLLLSIESIDMVLDLEYILFIETAYVACVVSCFCFLSAITLASSGCTGPNVENCTFVSLIHEKFTNFEGAWYATVRVSVLDSFKTLVFYFY